MKDKARQLQSHLDEDIEVLAAEWKNLSPEDQTQRLRGIIDRCTNLSSFELAEIRKNLKDNKLCMKKDFDLELKRLRRQRQGATGKSELDAVGQVKMVHGALDFPNGSILLGYRIVQVEADGKVLEKPLYLFKDITSWEIKVGVSSIIINGQSYAIHPRSSPPPLEDRWSQNNLKTFMSRPHMPDTVKLFGRVVEILKKYVELQHRSDYFLVAVWCIGTYLAHLFSAYAFLFFWGPKATGKSRVLEVLELICFNAVKVRDLTAAALGDTVEGQRGTILVDQAEFLKPNLVGLLADSYKKAGGRRRVIERHDGQRSVLEFSTYGPKGFAGQKSLDPDLLDRCIRFSMVKTKNQLPDFLGSEPEWLALRDDLYRWLLQCHGRVSHAYLAIPATGTRPGELWRSLEAVLRALGVDTGAITETRKAFDRGTQETKYQPEENEVELFDYLSERSGRKKRPFTLDMPDMADEMLQRIESINPQNLQSTNPADLQQKRKQMSKWVGETIRKFSLGRQLNRKGRKKIRRYEFKPKIVKDLRERYMDT